MKWFPSWVLVISCVHVCYSWDTDDYELFDLVEEVNTNFYTLLSVSEDANSTEIKKAYRKLSLLLHPDKNNAPDAEIKFRQLVAVYDVLRDSNKRSRYNLVLQNGLPDWRHVAFYYRRVRKMGLAEMSLILFIIVTVGQYVVAWAAYLEKKYTLEQLWEAKMKKLQKKQRKGKYEGPAIPETVPVHIPTPRVWDTLPFQLPKFLWFMVTLFPYTVSCIYEYICNRHQKEDAEQSSEEKEEEIIQVEHKGQRRRKGKSSAPPEANSSWEPSYWSGQNVHENSAREGRPLPVSGGLWTDDDLVELVRLIKKYPPGCSARWEKISQTMQRPVVEVTHMAKKVKEDGYRIRAAEDGVLGNAVEEEKPRKVKTRANKDEDTNTADLGAWSQPQQKALEAALIKYPKGGAGDRWEKIAKCVPGKSKEECMQRYKHLVDVVKRKKETVDTIPIPENAVA